MELTSSDSSKRTVHAYAKKEVVLSAGAINTPQILMLSGIGDKTALENVGIQHVVHLPAVGQHLQDHPNISVKFAFKPDSEAATSAYGKYVDDGPRMANCIAFFQSPQNRAREVRDGVSRGADLQMIHSSRQPFRNLAKAEVIDFEANASALLANDGEAESQRFGVMQSAYERENQRWNDDTPLHTGTGSIGVILNQVESRGSVRLRDGDPHSPPLIDPAFFVDPGEEDLGALVYGLRKAREIMLTEPFKSIVDLDQGILNAPPDLDWDDDDEVRTHIRAMAGTTWHYSCSCRMGTNSNSNSDGDGDGTSAVCDDRLRVGFGSSSVLGLRIADASVMPQVTSGNTNAPSVMIGNKAGEILLEEYQTIESSKAAKQSTAVLELVKRARL
jgi:choline dehydrogenase-like flavoprotein